MAKPGCAPLAPAGSQRLLLYDQLANLAPDLVPLTRNDSAEVRAAAGHSNVAITSGYLHVVGDEDDAIGDLFDRT